VPRRRLDQSAKPDARAENEPGVARLIAAGARPERGQDGTVAAVAAHGEIGQPHLGEGAAQLPQRGDRRVRPRDFAKRIVAQIEPAAGKAGPGNAHPNKPRGEAVRPLILKARFVFDSRPLLAFS
jgi:hypothetical protein